MTGHSKARRHGDQYHCAECGKQWDHDDPEPPPCRMESTSGQDAGREAVRQMRKLFSKTTLHSDK